MPYGNTGRARKLVNRRRVTGEAQKLRTRRAIVKAAIPIFARNGPDLPVISDFVKAAGISRGTFYNYFRSTGELLDAAIDDISDDLIETIIPIVADEFNPVIRFATAARLFYRKARLDPVFRAFFQSVSGVGALATKRVRGDLQEAMDQGLVSVTDMDLVEAVAFGIMVFALRSGQSNAATPGRGREVVRTMLNALGVKPDLIAQAMAKPLPPP